MKFRDLDPEKERFINLHPSSERRTLLPGRGSYSPLELSCKAFACLFVGWLVSFLHFFCLGSMFFENLCKDIVLYKTVTIFIVKL